MSTVKPMKALWIALALLMGAWCLAWGQVWVLSIDEEIGSGTVSYLRKGLSEAAAAGAAACVICFATPGGYLDAATSARDVIMDAAVPTIAYVDREAYSAGALLAIACERIYFAPGGVLGAATPVYFDPTGRMEEAPEKVVSAVRALFRATAEAKGRNPDVAEAMVDREVEIEGLVERGKLLTLTSATAAEWGYSDGEAPSLEEALNMAGLAGHVPRCLEHGRRPAVPLRPRNSGRRRAPSGTRGRSRGRSGRRGRTRSRWPSGRPPRGAPRSTGRRGSDRSG